MVHLMMEELREHLEGPVVLVDLEGASEEEEEGDADSFVVDRVAEV